MLEKEIQSRLQKALKKEEKAQAEVDLWEQLLAMATKEQKKLMT